MKNLKLSLLLSLVVIVKALNAQTSINHHEYFNATTPNEYFLSRGASLSFDNQNTIVCGGISTLLNDQGYDFGYNAFLLKTNLNGLPSLNKRYDINQNIAIGFDQVHEHASGYIYVATLIANRQHYGLLKIDATSGTVVSQNILYDLPSQDLIGSNVHFIKILDYNNHLYLVGYANYAYAQGPFTQFAYKTFIMKFDYNTALIDYRVYTINNPTAVSQTSDEETIASDAIIHTNSSTKTDELIIVGEGENLLKTMGSVYNHDAMFLLRVDMASLNPINLNFYPQVVAPLPLALEGSYAATICELGSDKLMIGGFYEQSISHYGLSIIECSENGTYIGNKSMYLPHLPNSTFPDPFLNRPNSIYAEYDVNQEKIVTVFGDIQFNGFYSKLKSHNKFNWDNRSFLLKYNYTNSSVINLKILTPISNTSIGTDKNYATKMLNLSQDNLILIGNNLSTKVTTPPNLIGTTYFVNDYQQDMTGCMKLVEESETNEVSFTRIGIVPDQWTPANTKVTYTINVTNNDDNEVCNAVIPVDDGSETQFEFKYNLTIKNVVETKTLSSSDIILKSDKFINYSAWDIPAEILSLLDEKTLYIGELVNTKTLEKRIFKFTKQGL